MEKVRGEERDMRVGVINTYTDANSIANNRALLASFRNSQDEKASIYNKSVKKDRRRMYMEIFDERNFLKIDKKPGVGGKTVEVCLQILRQLFQFRALNKNNFQMEEL